MDGCNPQRTFTLGAAYVPDTNNQSLKLNWTFTARGTSFTSLTAPLNGQYLGCSTNVENGKSNAISCLFVDRGLYTLNQHGELLWSYNDALIASEIGNISSAPLLLPGPVTVIDSGLEIMAFQDGVLKFADTVSNLSLPSNTLSKWSAGFVQSEYFTIALGDGRFSVYDFATLSSISFLHFEPNLMTSN